MAERRTRRTGRSRLRPLLPLAAVWSVGFAVLIGLALQRQVPYDELLLDPNNVAGVPWYTGLVSNLGILGWTTATATGFFGAWIAHYGGRGAAARMLLEGALLSGLLLFDDLLQLHVIVEPLFGIPKIAAYGLYATVALHWAVTQHRELRRTPIALLVAAGGAFALSVGLDQVPGLTSLLDADRQLLAEDAAKFLGVLAWAEFFVLTSGAIVTSIVTELRLAGTPSPQPTPSPTDRPPGPADPGGGADHPSLVEAELRR